MKVVLFCGGLGTRLREYSETVPKPMVEIGNRPLMWHLMRYYAHYGHNEFILCLGYKGDVIKKYFLEYNECYSNDFVLKDGGKEICLFNNDIDNWTISFIDTGVNSNIGQRLMAVRHLLKEDEMFLANYADGLSDLDLFDYLDRFQRSENIGCFLSVKPSQSFHVVSFRQADEISNITPVLNSNIWINGGFFAFRREIFNYIHEGEELVVEPFQRLLAENKLMTYRNPQFWACIDTLKEKMMFDEMYANGKTPWMVWNHTLNHHSPNLSYHYKR